MEGCFGFKAQGLVVSGLHMFPGGSLVHAKHSDLPESKCGFAVRVDWIPHLEPQILPPQSCSTVKSLN